MSSFEDSVATAEVQQPEQSLADQQYQQPGYQQQPEAPQTYQQPYQQQGYQQPYNQQQYAYGQQAAAPADSGSIGWAILGFFIPLVGLILFLVWKNTKPKCAKMAGIGALVGVCINIAYLFLGGGMLAMGH